MRGGPNISLTDKMESARQRGKGCVGGWEGMERYQPQGEETDSAKGTAVREKFMAVVRIPGKVAGHDRAKTPS